MVASPEKVIVTDASIIQMINNYCGHEAGVRNLKKALDRVFRKIVAKIENQPESAVAVDATATTTTMLVDEAEIEY